MAEQGDDLAQSIRHWTLNSKVLGSNLLDAAVMTFGQAHYPLIALFLGEDIERPVPVVPIAYLRPYLTGLETRWRLVGDSSLRWLRRRLHASPGDSGSPGSRGKLKHDFFWRLFQSPAGIGDKTC